MSDYIVSARKYRPDSFESLIGQDIIAQTLKNSVLRGQLAHAYLFCGPRGVGKTSTARIFAKTINCANPGPDLEPCGHCESCESFQEGRSYCIYELDAASNNSVDDIKALMEKVQVPPQVGKYSVYIIDEVHMLSQAAFNAFLKTLEEPPSYAIFILCTTEKHKVLPTILSRCQTYDFNRIGVSDIVRNLKAIAAKEGITADDGSLHVIAQKADGAMRDALTIFDQTVAFCGNDIKYEDVIHNLGILDYEYSFKLVDAFLVKDYATALLTLDEVMKKGFNALHFITALGEHLRDLLVCRTGGLEALVEMPDSLKQKYNEQAAKCSVKFIYDALGVVSECEAGYKTSVNQRLHIEYALMRLAFLGGVPASAAAAVPANSEGRATRGTEAGGPPASAGGGVSPKGELPQREQAQAVAPAPEPVPAPEPAPAPKVAHRNGVGSKFASILNGEGEIKPVEKQANLSSDLPSEEAIRAAWPKLVDHFSAGKANLKATLNAAPLTISDRDGVRVLDFQVVNPGQKNWLEAKIFKDMGNKFCELLGSRKVALSISVLPETKVEKKAYTPQEQAQELMAANPEIKNLVQDLSLDVR